MKRKQEKSNKYSKRITELSQRMKLIKNKEEVEDIIKEIKMIFKKAGGRENEDEME